MIASAGHDQLDWTRRNANSLEKQRFSSDFALDLRQLESITCSKSLGREAFGEDAFGLRGMTRKGMSHGTSIGVFGPELISLLFDLFAAAQHPHRI